MYLLCACLPLLQLTVAIGADIAVVLADADAAVAVEQEAP